MYCLPNPDLVQKKEVYMEIAKVVHTTECPKSDIEKLSIRSRIDQDADILIGILHCDLLMKGMTVTVKDPELTSCHQAIVDISWKKIVEYRVYTLWSIEVLEMLAHSDPSFQLPPDQYSAWESLEETDISSLYSSRELLLPCLRYAVHAIEHSLVYLEDVLHFEQFLYLSPHEPESVNDNILYAIAHHVGGTRPGLEGEELELAKTAIRKLLEKKTEIAIRLL